MVKIFRFLLLVVFQIPVTVFALSEAEHTLADTISIAEIEVTATMLEGNLKSVSGSISVLGSEQIATHDQITITQQFNSLPGIYMHSGNFNTNRIVIRGIGSRTPYSSNRIRAYLDDIPLTNGDGVTTLEDIDVNRLGRIEVIKGPFSALYGSGLGGTIKLTTSSSDQFFDARFQQGSFYTRQLKVLGGFQLNKTQVNASFHQTHSDGYRENNRYDRNSCFLKVTQNWKKTDVALTMFMVNVDAQIPSSIDETTFINSPESAASNWLNAEGYEQNERFLAGMTITHRFSESTSNKTTLFAGSSNSFEHRPFNDLKDDASNYGIRSQLQFHYSKLNFITGIELYSEQYKWGTSIDQNGTTISLNEVDENRKYANIFQFISYQPFQQLHLTGGLNVNRLNYVYSGNNTTDDSYSYPFIVSPRLGFNFEATSNMNYYGSVGHGFSAPSLEETLLPNGEKNPGLKPETGIMSELGFRYFDSGKRWFIDGCFYFIGLNNLLVTKRISEEIFMGVNAGKSHHAGVEFQTEYRLFQQSAFPGYLSMNASVTFSNNLFIDFEDDGKVYSGNHLPGIPAQTVYAGLNWKPVEHLSFNLHQNYFGKQYLNDTNEGTYPGVYLLNFNSSYKLILDKKWSANLTFGINNLFDKNYASMILVNAPVLVNQVQRYYYPGLPRNYYVALSIQF